MGKGSGITNAQAKYLASLQRKLGVRYTGNGMSRVQAAAAIDMALRKLGRPVKPDPRSTPTITQREMIRVLGGVLGREIEVPATEREARFLIDDLMHEERQIKRVRVVG